ncbi:MAG: hypothetical protein GY946_20370 [bacterium]|nr:hypothetical protein [bacterium]
MVIARDRRPELDASGLAYRVLVPDLAAKIAAEKQRIARSTPARAPWFDEYKTLDEIESYLTELASADADLVTHSVIGTSIEGRDIVSLEVRKPGPDKPSMLIIGTQHAREWISPMTAVCLADALIRDADLPAHASLLDRVDILLVPVVNPDGYVYSWDERRMWRKNRRDGHGVDLNRNWDSNWGEEPGSSADMDDSNYRGTAPWSEPESAAVRDLVDDNPRLRAMIDLHSYGQQILTPPGVFDESVPDEDEIMDLATWMQRDMEATHSVRYDVLRAIDLYPAAGTAPDWAYEERDIFGYTIELRPEPRTDDGHILPPEQIMPTCEETLAGILALGEWVADPGPGDGGTSGGEADLGSGDSATSGTTGGSSDGDAETGGGTAGEGTAGGGTTGDEPEPGTGSDGGEEEQPEGPAPQGCGCTAPRRSPRGFGWLVLAASPLVRRRR